MKKSLISTVAIVLLSVMMLIVSCGDDPFFHNLVIRNDEGKTVTTIVVREGDYTLPGEVDGLEGIEGWIYEDKEYAVGDVISVTKDSEITAMTGTPVIVDNGDGTTQKVVVKKGETTLTLPKAPAERSGYVFDGWLVNNTLKEASAVVDYSEDMEIKAKWTNGGTGTIAPDTLRADKESILLSDGKGYTNGTSRLTAWNTSADGSGTEYKTGAAYSVKADVTFYAVWRNEVTVSFEMNGGSPAVAPQTVTYGTCATKPADPSKTDCTFAGWVDKDGATFNFETTAVTEDITLTAMWEYNIGSSGPGGGYVFSKTAKSGGGYSYLEGYLYSGESTYNAVENQVITFCGYSDWRLPSISELETLYGNKTIISGKTGGDLICSGQVWSSDAGDTAGSVKLFNFTDKSSTSVAKTAEHRVVLVRSF